MQAYKIWRPLDPSKSEIRLLQLHPAPSEEVPIECTLQKVSLDSAPAYRALSYTWGTEIAQFQIRIGGIQQSITKNLDEALRHFRLIDSAVIIYVDALCIDQTSVFEKNVQVPLMRRIYTQAEHVHCWLGRATKEDARPFEILRRSRDESMVGTVIEGRHVETADFSSLKRVLQLPY